LIYGGIETSGYSNELWKFDWGTREYSLINWSNSPPKSAYSQCHIERNSENQMIFKVYMGETESVAPLAFIYEYNLILDKWDKILYQDGSFDLGRSKEAVFMINEKLIYAGGSAWKSYSFDSINMLEKPYKEDNLTHIGRLPSFTYYGASVYYKNKIYIHGGGYSFGYLPIGKIVINDLVVINLNEKCEDSEDHCIATCSKGTYFKDEGSTSALREATLID
jgi:hypothetical protein